MNALTFEEIERVVCEDFNEVRQAYKQPDYGITLEQAVSRLQAVMPGYATLIKSDSVIDSNMLVDVSTIIKYQENFFRDNNDNQEEMLKAFMKSERVWRNIGNQLDNYVRNHPVMLAENPPSAGVIGISRVVPNIAFVLDEEIFCNMIKCTLAVMVKVYFQH